MTAKEKVKINCTILKDIILLEKKKKRIIAFKSDSFDSFANKISALIKITIETVERVCN